MLTNSQDDAKVLAVPVQAVRYEDERQIVPGGKNRSPAYRHEKERAAKRGHHGTY